MTVSAALLSTAHKSIRSRLQLQVLRAWTLTPGPDSEINSPIWRTCRSMSSYMWCFKDSSLLPIRNAAIAFLIEASGLRSSCNKRAMDSSLRWSAVSRSSIRTGSHDWLCPMYGSGRSGLAMRGEPARDTSIALWPHQRRIDLGRGWGRVGRRHRVTPLPVCVSGRLHTSQALLSAVPDIGEGLRAFRHPRQVHRATNYASSTNSAWKRLGSKSALNG